jgi:hypothetical protein
MDRDLTDGAGEGDGQLSAGAGIPKQDIGNGVPAFLAGQPGFQH